MIGQPVGPLRFIPGENRGRYPYCNPVYIEEAGILIDPGSDRKALIKLRDTRPVRQIWLSHWHVDGEIIDLGSLTVEVLPTPGLFRVRGKGHYEKASGLACKKRTDRSRCRQVLLNKIGGRLWKKK